MNARHLRRRWPVWNSALAIARSILLLVRTRREQRRGRRQLAAMSERELLDIGLYRADIADGLDKPFWRDRRGRLP